LRTKRSGRRAATPSPHSEASGEFIAEIDAEVDDADDEPALGSGGVHGLVNQEGWAAGSFDDREDEHDGQEPDDEGEPSLSSLDRQIDQLAAWCFDQWQVDFEEAPA
jgi:hypothetical protein